MHQKVEENVRDVKEGSTIWKCRQSSLDFHCRVKGRKTKSNNRKKGFSSHMISANGFWHLMISLVALRRYVMYQLKLIPPKRTNNPKDHCQMITSSFDVLLCREWRRRPLTWRNSNQCAWWWNGNEEDWKYTDAAALSGSFRLAKLLSLRQARGSPNGTNDNCDARETLIDVVGRMYVLYVR